MIRVNLLETGAKHAGAGVDDDASGTPVLQGTLIVLGALLLVGVHYVWLLNRGPELQRQLTAANAENNRMQQVKEQVTALQAQQRDLQNRIEAIQQLGDKASGPSPLLTTLGQSADGGPNLWLSEVEETGPAMEVEGLASNLDRIADFMTALQQSGQFADIRLDDSTQKTGLQPHTPFTFHLGLQMTPPPGTAPAPTPAAHGKSAP